MTERRWMQVRAILPEDIGLDVIKFLRGRYGFVATDWCVLGKRGDKSRVDFAPCPPPDSQLAP